jgi:DNA-binding NarL/FixJ family response regulator
MKVFLVDDSIIIRQRLKRLLAAVQDVQIIGEAASELEATDAIEKHNPDLVLLDIHLLDGNGIAVLRHLKKGKRAPKVIILTDYPYPQYRHECIEAGADFFFIKSSEFDQVVPTLIEILRQGSGSTEPSSIEQGGAV